MSPDERSAAYAALPFPVFRERWATLPSRSQRDEALRLRFRVDQGNFLRWAFPAMFSRPWNRFHRDVLDEVKIAASDRRENDYRVDAAPRGIAKTTLLKGEFIHDVCYGLEDFIVVVSAETRLARSITKHMRRIFAQSTGRLAQLYGPFTVEGGVDEFSVTTPNGHRTGFLARSFGTQIRGANEDAARPTKIAIDDGERSDRVRNPKLRRDDHEFLNDDILASGPITGGLKVRWRGTVLHTDAILPNLVKSDGWNGAVWKACERWPDRMDLWEACGKVFADLTIGDVKARYAAAWRFYEDNREEMDRGAVMLDNAAMPLFALFVEVWTKGWRSVLRERQNEASAPGTKFFRVRETKPGAGDGFGMCTIQGNKRIGGFVTLADGRRVDFAECQFFARLDPIPGDDLDALGEDGGAGQGDDAAIVVLGRDPHGYGFVAAAWHRRCRDTEQLAALWTLCEDWRCVKVTVESNGFQRLLGQEFRNEQTRRRERDQWWQVAVENDVSKTDKNERIATLEAPATHRHLQFSRTLPPKLFQQFDEFPTANHDDLPDAVEGAWRLSNTVRVGMVNHPLGAPATPFRR